MARENQPTAAPPVFILSCERSGSTLLRYIVDTHPQVCCPAHLHLGQLCRSLYTTAYYSIAQAAGAADDAARERLAAAETRRVVDELMGRYARAKGKQVWCEKTTENLQHLRFLGEVFPDARFVCLYRNCMDVAHSGIESGRLGFIPELAPYVQKSPGNLVAAMVESWVEKTAALLDFELAHAPQCFRLKYESLVLRPSETLRAMFAALGLGWDEGLLGAVFSTKHDEGSGDRKILFTKRINTDSIGRGSTLAREDIPAALLERMNELLARLDYPPVGPDWGSSPSPYLPAGAQAEAAEAVSSVEEVFGSYIPRLLKSGRAGLQGVEGRCRFDVGDGGGAWLLTLPETDAAAQAPDADADCTVRISAGDLLDLVNGRQNVMAAFDQGKIHVTGDYELANKVGRLIFGA
ncbi:MAG TPA: sulfotransferase [Pyrinomonadaceae bacterium]|jgi:hypothetical protein